MAAPRQSKCGKCGKTVGYGLGIVVEFGGGGRYHSKCLPAGTKQLANGNEFPGRKR